jgi:hypothetical protein
MCGNMQAGEDPVGTAYVMFLSNVLKHKLYLMVSMYEWISMLIGPFVCCLLPIGTCLFSERTSSARL